jgi:hypothetical protein
MGIDHPKGIIKNIVPIVMAGVLGIYGLIVSVIITQAISPPAGENQTNTYSLFNGYTHVRNIPTLHDGKDFCGSHRLGFICESDLAMPVSDCPISCSSSNSDFSPSCCCSWLPVCAVVCLVLLLAALLV